MEIKVKYGLFYSDAFYHRVYHSVEVSLYDEKQAYYPFFYDDILADGKKRVDMKDLLSELVLKEKKVDYYIDKTTNLIIPTGLVDFLKEDGGRSTLKIFVEDRDELYKLDKVIQSIVIAIKVKYKAKEIDRKCVDSITESII